MQWELIQVDDPALAVFYETLNSSGARKGSAKEDHHSAAMTGAVGANAWFQRMHSNGSRRPLSGTVAS